MLNSLLNKHYHVWCYARSVCMKKSLIYTQIILTFINVHARIAFTYIPWCRHVQYSLHNLVQLKTHTYRNIYIIYIWITFYRYTHIFITYYFIIISIYSSSIMYANQWKILFLPFYSNFVMSCFWVKFFSTKINQNDKRKRNAR